ncbi:MULTISPECIES: hypothetical protein [Stenotrophomonas]|uniref:hypothetical protein n=1 Tax=Stenotrophomonas TaxID=40323 RepID=UPI001115AA25|nr:MULTISPECIES: hypothetical protein [Stenotrophomonas]QGL99543.1 hypothetical protein FEO89_01745 [Stenotrophomonas maltophilia]HDS1603553.1 hypothetical protein [Stenotrophomonas maltophilia]
MPEVAFGKCSEMCHPVAASKERRVTSSLYPRLILGAAVALIAAYIWMFRANELGSPESWGQFGDFLGGSLNPLIGVVTVLLVLETLQVTRREASDNRAALEQQRVEMERQTAEAAAQTRNTEQQLIAAESQLSHLAARDELNELQKCLDALTTELIASLQRPTSGELLIGGSLRMFIHYSPRGSKYEALTKLSIPQLIQIRNDVKTGTASHYRSGYIHNVNAWTNEFGYETELIREAAHYCSIYEEKTGDGAWSLHYYKRRAYPLAEALAALGIVEEDVRLALMPKPFPKLDN